MAQTIDFYIDTTSGQLVAAGSGASGILPTFTRNDVYTFRVRLQERDTGGFLRDVDTSGTNVKIGIGVVDEGPTDGAFKLAVNSVTSSAITYSSDEATLASAIYAAVSNNVSSVTQFGSEQDAFILTATGTNTAMSFGGDSFTLFPTTNLLISTRRNQSANAQAQQILKLRRSPAVYADTFVASTTAGVVSLVNTQEGSSVSSLNETYKLTIGRDAEGGGVVLNYGSNSTTAVPIGSSAASFNEALSAVTGIGAGNISVDSGNNLGEYTITFVKDLGSINVATPLTLDASGVVFAKFLESTVTFGTSDLDEIFADNGTSTITPTLEIEISESGQPKTVYQGSISVRKDLITTGSAVPAAQASYYTKAEIDAFSFLKSSTTGFRIAGASRIIYNANGDQRVRVNDTGLGFFGVTPVAQPANVNVVSGLINLGFFATGTTYGVLPQSPRTLTTTASLTFGTISNNSTSSITVAVTGAVPNDIVLLGLPAVVCQGLSFFGHVSTDGVVEVDAVNATNGSIVQSQATYRITVIGY